MQLSALLVATSLILASAATSLRSQQHLHGDPKAEVVEDAERCFEGFKGETLADKCNAMMAHVQRGAPLNATTMDNSTMVAKKEETCEEINARLEELKEQKKRCETPDGVPEAGGWPDKMEVKGSWGGASTCWKSLQKVLPRYIEHYEELKKKNGC